MNAILKKLFIIAALSIINPIICMELSPAFKEQFPYLLSDARPQFKEKIEPLLKECGIKRKIIIKETELADCNAFVKLTLTGKYYLVVDSERDPNNPLFIKTALHEAGHIYNNHNLKSLTCFSLMPLTTYLLTKKTLQKILPKQSHNHGLIAISSGLVITQLGLRFLSKFQEMEADLFAIDKLCNKKYRITIAERFLDLYKYADHQDSDDGMHPTKRETFKYGSQFYKEKLAGKNPSIKKYCWNYMANEHAPKPIGKIIQRFVKND